MHLLDHPEDASDSKICVDRIPKKLKDMLQFTHDGENRGWGVYFDEESDLTTVVRLISLLGICASLVFGTWWNVARHDIQGAWGVASWMVTAIGMISFTIRTS